MSETIRVDEVEKHYKPVEQINKVLDWLFWGLVALSFLQIFKTSLPPVVQDCSAVLFLAGAITSLALSIASRSFLTPKAERARRKQNLSNAFGAKLSNEKTNLYYNNSYKHSILRLGANTFENSLFSKETSAGMLKTTRIGLLVYFVVWFVVLALRQSNLDLITWITQFIFSTDILGYWIALELLRHRNEKVFERYHEFFRHSIDDRSAEGMATILDIYSDYESAKASAGIKLDSKIFHKLNPSLTAEWERIKEQLGMNLTQQNGESSSVPANETSS